MIMRASFALLAICFAASGCGGRSPKPISVRELQAAFGYHGLHTYLVFDQRRLPRHASSVAVPILADTFSWKRFAPAYALLADRQPAARGSLPAGVHVEAYVFSTSAGARSAAHSCPTCLFVRNVVVVTKRTSNSRVSATLAQLK